MTQNNENELRNYTANAPGGITVSVSNTRQSIEIMNNKSRYYAELAKQYKDEAKAFRDGAKTYAEENSDVTMLYVNELEARLQREIDSKQASGDYALNSALPTKVSDLTNDSGYLTSSNIATTTDLGVVKVDGATITANNEGIISAIRADKDLQNLTAFGNSRLQYAPFAVNTGSITGGENSALTYSGANISCTACTITTCDGRTYVDDTARTLDISNEADGGYHIFKSSANGSLSVISDFVISKIAPVSPSSGDYWLDISTIPANLKTYDGSSWGINNDIVYIGDVVISSGAITSLSNRIFNDSGYFVDRYSKAVIIETYINGSSWYRLYSDGWCEQGGYNSGASGGASVSLLKNYKNTNYFAMYMVTTSDNSNHPSYMQIHTKTENSFFAKTVSTGGNQNVPFYWSAKGYIS